MAKQTITHCLEYIDIYVHELKVARIVHEPLETSNWQQEEFQLHTIQLVPCMGNIVSIVTLSASLVKYSLEKQTK